ncbi:MAG: glycine--tRNA ligase subunit beta [Ideonella sp.]|nr:glycine--tRNA ligase subunit beta [Ideonella sp.]MCC7458891.1 glycine--tRNA ligase subunit beta [Nitrospira sp.]
MSAATLSPAKSLLVELFVEELPPKALRLLGDAFAARLFDGLKAHGLAGEQSAVTPYATPRRLAVHISHVLAVAADEEVVRKVMPVSVALDPAGRPTAALRKALAKLGREALADRWPAAVDGEHRLYEAADGKVSALFLRSKAAGATLAAGLQAALDEAIAKLPIPKLMSYQLDASAGPSVQPGWSTVQFVRPAHGLVALHGADVVPVHALGLAAGRDTRGHRFEAAVDPIRLRDADHYAQQLEQQGAVIAAFAHRRAEVARQLQHAAGALQLEPVRDDALLDEVTALVERPNVLVCEFEPQFLAVPPECLILTMKANQKYFPLLDGQGRLTHRFLLVSNIRPDDASAIVRGNERVVRPRLADAKFFFDQDRKRTLESRLAALDKVVYHAKLGSMGERVRRVAAIATAVGEQLGGAALAAQAARAAQLAKADLLTDMVGEFPELQGVMGGYYARHDGEREAVACAIEDHYKPRFAGDALPRDAAGLAVALADKLETLVGLFGIGQAPSGDKDPFALRRHALGVIRMLVERDLPLAVPHLIGLAAAAFADGARAAEPVTGFLYDRLVGYLRELGYSALEVEAVVALRPPRWGELPARLAAVKAFAALPEAASLAAANKRITNILKKSDAHAAEQCDAARLVEPAERALAAALAAVAPRADALFAAGEYTASLCALAALKEPVDAFFDHVMVNADDPALRANRLALLQALHGAMNRVAELARLAA